MDNNGEVLEALEDCVELLDVIRHCCHNQEGMVDAQIRDAKAVIAKAREIKNGKDETFERSEV